MIESKKYGITVNEADGRFLQEDRHPPDMPHNYYDDNGFFHCNLMDFLLGNIELF